VFTRLIREITVAAKLGGGDPNTNPRLRLAMDKAREANMTKDSVQNAIKRGTGQLEGVTYEEIRYQGYGIGGSAVIVDCMTDNRIRTVAEVRHAFTRHGGNLGTDGSVDFMFRHCGQRVCIGVVMRASCRRTVSTRRVGVVPGQTIFRSTDAPCSPVPAAAQKAQAARPGARTR
jgi:YebC/PmpR family DNA-binding regulatory protein